MTDSKTTTTHTDTIPAIVREQGSGHADVGEYVVEPVSGELYRVVEIIGRINTGDPRGEYRHALLETADWYDTDADPLCVAELSR